MEKIATSLPDVWILEPKVFGDYRGYFMETYNRETFASLGIHNDWVQDNQSFTQKKGTLRGIHFQNAPMAQAKLRAAGLSAEVEISRSPRRTTDEGTPRVVRAQEGLLTVCYFPDGDPANEKSE